MINDVRNTVLAILSKDNNGYITPEQFNLYAKNAQMEIFEQYAHDYSLAVNKRNKHLYGSGLGDIPTRLAEVINRFNTSAVLAYDGTTANFRLPIDAYSLSVISTVEGEVIEPVAQNKILKLNASLDTAPTTDYPVYTIHNNLSWTSPFYSQIKVYPTTIINNVLIDYIRYPKAPKWTYLSVTDGSPIFNSQASDHQDFELQQDEETNLTLKILQYSGIQISDPNVVQAAKADEVQEKQEQK